jgi:hypothetical protein
MEVDGSYDRFYDGIDLTALENIDVTGTPRDCQFLVALHSSGLIHPDEDDEYNLSHWQLLEYHCIKEEEMLFVPFSSDLQMEYLILHGLESDLWVPLPFKNVIDEDGNDVNGFDDLRENVTLSFSEDNEFPTIFMSENQINDNIKTVNKIVEASCRNLNMSSINSPNLKDLVLLYMKSNQ